MARTRKPAKVDPEREAKRQKAQEEREARQQAAEARRRAAAAARAEAVQALTTAEGLAAFRGQAAQVRFKVLALLGRAPGAEIGDGTAALAHLAERAGSLEITAADALFVERHRWLLDTDTDGCDELDERLAEELAGVLRHIPGVDEWDDRASCTKEYLWD